MVFLFFFFFFSFFLEVLADARAVCCTRYGGVLIHPESVVTSVSPKCEMMCMFFFLSSTLFPYETCSSLTSTDVHCQATVEDFKQRLDSSVATWKADGTSDALDVTTTHICSPPPRSSQPRSCSCSFPLAVDLLCWGCCHR